jgi:hypothetical protein
MDRQTIVASVDPVWTLPNADLRKHRLSTRVQFRRLDITATDYRLSSFVAARLDAAYVSLYQSESTAGCVAWPRAGARDLRFSWRRSVTPYIT